MPDGNQPKSPTAATPRGYGGGVDDAGTAVYLAPGLLRRLVPRQHLVDRITEGTRFGVTIVRGAAGTGKSVLLSEWAHSRRGAGAPAVWITVDAHNSGRLAFWQSVVDTVVGAGLAPDGSLLADTVPTAGAPEMLRSTLLRGVRELGDPLLLVIDDFHLISDPAVADELLWLLERTDRLRVLIGTRVESEFESPVATARFAPTLITGDEIAFNAADTRRAVVDAGLELDESSINAITSQVEGWPLGVRLLLVELESRGGAGFVSAAATANTVISRSTARLITSLSGSTYLPVLLRSSIAERLSDDLLGLLAPESEIFGALDWMEREGLGTRDQSGLFRHHPLIRAALESEFVKRYPEEVVAQRRRLAHWATQNNDVPTAIRQAALSRDWELLASATKRHFGLIMRLHGAEMQAALDSVPGAVLRRSPLLVTVLALLLNSQEPTTGQRLRTLANVTISLTRDRLSRDRTPERMWLLLCTMAVERISGRHDQAARTADEILVYLPDFAADPAEGLEQTRSVVQLQVATSLFYVGRYRDATSLLREVAPASPPWGAIHALSLDALIPAMRGDMVATSLALAPLRQRQSPAGWRGTYSSTGYHLAEAMLKLERFDVAAARREVAALDRHRATIEHWPLLIRVDGLIALADNAAFDGAQRIAAEVSHRRISSTSQSMSAMVTSTRSDLLLAAGQAGRARQLLSASGLPVSEIALSLARVELAENHNSLAIELVEPLIWDESDLPRTQAEALLVRAVALARSGSRDAAREALERSLGVMQRAGLRLPLMMVPRAELLDLLRDLGEWNGEPSEKILEGVPAPFGEVSVLEPLSARELEVLAALATTRSASEIASALFVSTNTVKSQLRSIYRKLGVSSRADALRTAAEHGIKPGAP